MNAANRLTPSAPKQTFSSAITSNAMQGLIQKSLKDSKAVARFTSTMISAVNASDQLKACDPGSVVAAALRGEGMGLNLGMGYYLVPYGQTCTFVIGYKGLIALALATGRYEDIDCMDIREGEYQAETPVPESRSSILTSTKWTRTERKRRSSDTTPISSSRTACSGRNSGR